MHDRANTAVTDVTAAQLEWFKGDLLERFAAEQRTTMRLLRAMPESHHDFRPHERSATALELVSTIAREQAGIVAVLEGSWSMPPSFPAPPATWSEALGAVDGGGSAVLAALETTPARRLAESVPFFVGPQQVGPMIVRELLWFWLLDSVHHRGQLSVYVRLAGGRVPAMYGPSADEPWA